MNPKRRLLSWPEVIERCRRVAPDCVGRLYGVPRGGAIVAGLLTTVHTGIEVVDDPALADVIVDDVVDSGKTRARFLAAHPRARFVALYDKQPEWLVFPWEHRDDTSDIEDTVVRQLEFIGEDPSRPGLIETPRRYIKAMREMTGGLHEDPTACLNKVFEEDHDEIVTVCGVEFVSLCEHHLLPFIGRVDFGYLPSGRVVGLSKIPRLIQCLARRPQVQERLTAQIADEFSRALAPRGVAVVVRAVHSCMRYRGVRSAGEMRTSVVRGAFRDSPEARAEAFRLMGV